MHSTVSSSLLAPARGQRRIDDRTGAVFTVVDYDFYRGRQGAFLLRSDAGEGGWREVAEVSALRLLSVSS